jgi:hypothetical protein
VSSVSVFSRARSPTIPTCVSLPTIERVVHHQSRLLFTSPTRSHESFMPKTMRVTGRDASKNLNKRFFRRVVTRHSVREIQRSLALHGADSDSEPRFLRVRVIHTAPQVAHQSRKSEESRDLADGRPQTRLLSRDPSAMPPTPVHARRTSRRHGVRWPHAPRNSPRAPRAPPRRQRGAPSPSPARTAPRASPRRRAW